MAIPDCLPYPVTPVEERATPEPPPHTLRPSEDELLYPADYEEIAPATTNTCPLCGFWKFSVRVTCSLCHEHLLTGGAWDEVDDVEERLAHLQTEGEDDKEEEYICRGCGFTFMDDGSADGFCSPRCAGGRSCYCCYF